MSRNSVNKVILLGNLGADPETRFTPSGTQVVTVSLATSDTGIDKSGERRERTEWHRLVLWRRLAEIAGQYLRRGSRVYVEGKLQTRSWEDVKGQRHYMTEVVVSDLQLLDSPSGPAEMDLSYARQESRPAAGEAVEEVAAELPF
jgi:single-strand DNA-binding protein